VVEKGVTRKSGNYGVHNGDERRRSDRPRGKRSGRRSATRGDGSTRRLWDAGHRGVIGGTGVEGQENRSVVILSSTFWMDLRGQLNDLRMREKKNLGHGTESHVATGGSLGYSRPLEERCALRRWCCGLNLWHILPTDVMAAS
jgi:hypothetical protein